MSRNGKQPLGRDPKSKSLSPYAKLPYPIKKKAKSQEHQFRKFLNLLNTLEMSIPFAEALEQIPQYAKFMKELLTKKRKPLEDETVNLTE
ncbi:hypothetical protein A2U01_0037359, partial [Trifolium medium]|nr:hypothetical protein [Trifolium medium]